MVGRRLCILVDELLVYYQRVSNKEVSNVSGQAVVNPSVNKSLVSLLVNVDLQVIVLFRLVLRPIGDEEIDGRVSRFGNVAHFLLGSVIDRGGDDIPAHVVVGEVSAQGRGGRGEGQENGGQNGQLIVQVPGLLHIAGLQGNLQTRESHAKGHAVHVNIVGHGAGQVLGAVESGIDGAREAAITHVILANGTRVVNVQDGNRLGGFFIAQ
mmetsp:Transcript_26144/g.63511  ORF Transcript_26144/g.63511 Transcript_26144/m.63511 type:complete len:210 (+) Transcript_26144:138-767(+)